MYPGSVDLEVSYWSGCRNSVNAGSNNNNNSRGGGGWLAGREAN